MTLQLPTEYAQLDNSVRVPCDRNMVLHVARHGTRRPDVAWCGNRVAMVPLSTVVAHGTGVCAVCHGASSGMTPPKRGE